MSARLADKTRAVLAEPCIGPVYRTSELGQSAPGKSRKEYLPQKVLVTSMRDRQSCYQFLVRILSQSALGGGATQKAARESSIL
jgi:hypothetical protein